MATIEKNKNVESEISVFYKNEKKNKSTKVREHSSIVNDEKKEVEFNSLNENIKEQGYGNVFNMNSQVSGVVNISDEVDKIGKVSKAGKNIKAGKSSKGGKNDENKNSNSNNNNINNMNDGDDKDCANYVHNMNDRNNLNYINEPCDNKKNTEGYDENILNDEGNLSDEGEEVEEENVDERDLILQRYKHGINISLNFSDIRQRNKIIDFYSECLDKYKNECNFVYYQNYNNTNNVIINDTIDMSPINTKYFMNEQLDPINNLSNSNDKCVNSKNKNLIKYANNNMTIINNNGNTNENMNTNINK